MKFLIIGHAAHKIQLNKVYSYAPYVREMNLWLKNVDSVDIVAPFSTEKISKIDLPYNHNQLGLIKIPSLAFTSFKSAFLSMFKIPRILILIYKACKSADHIHLRSPGNIALLGCIVQILFPKKVKTAKYAGNWDSKSKQPISYRLQKFILSNTFLTRNINVLVYGEWKKQSKNIIPFFTATYSNSERENVDERDYLGTLKFMFVGSLVKGKRPLLAIKIVEAFHKKGRDVRLNIYGDGVLKDELKTYINKNGLAKIIILHGNQDKETIKQAYKKAHLLLLPSKSEGWPKAIAEAMFFGVIPIATKISCVPYMLGFGSRGILISPEVTMAENSIESKTETELKDLSKNALKWSQKYTLEVFENSIKQLLEH